jgi:nicotinamidase-related amidase
MGGHPTLGRRLTAAALRLDPARTALVVIDMQEKLLPAIEGRAGVLANSLLLLRLAGVLDLPVVLTTQYERGLGGTVPDVRALCTSEPLDKVSFGCFGDAAFRERLAALTGRDQLLVAGIESHICVAQTVLGALDAGLHVHVASDAVGARRESNRQVGLARMERAGALLSSAEMAVYELLGRSDGPAFKAMLPHLRG